MNVLLLDDAEKLRTRYAEALAELPGVEVAAFECGSLRVLREIEKMQIDVVILDVQLAQGGALDLIHDIKAALHPPVVIAMSSVSSLKYRSMCQKAGAEFFFNKVNETEALLRAVVEIQNELER